MGMHQSVCITVLAAGAARRMGSPKQLARIGGESLVRRACRIALDARLGDVCLVTGAYADRVEDEVRGMSVRILSNARWEEGQSTSVRLAVSHCNAHGYRWLIVLPVDMPLVTADHLRSLLDEALRTGFEIVASRGEAGLMAPCVFAASAFSVLSLLQGDRGAVRVIRDPAMAGRVRAVPFSNAYMAFDVDTEKDLMKARMMLHE